MQKVIDGPIGQDLLDKVTNSGKGLVGLAWMDAGARNFYNTKKPIKTMADLKGMKVRVMGNPMFVDMANSMGGNGVAMGYDQVFNALQTGVVDGAENNPPSFVFDNHYQVAKFYTDRRAPDRAGDGCDSRRRSSTRYPRTNRRADKILPRSAARRAQALGHLREGSDGQGEGRRHPDHPGFGRRQKSLQDAVKPVWDKYGPKYADLIKRIQDVK